MHDRTQSAGTTNSIRVNDQERSPRLENEWKRVFDRYGIEDERRREHFVELVFSAPEFTRDSPDITEIRGIVERKLDHLNFEPYIGDVSPGVVERALLRKLDRALHGEFRGPASAPVDIAYSNETLGDDSPDEQPPENQESVEAAWKRILKEYGAGGQPDEVEERQAEHVVELVFSAPELTRDNPDIDDIRDIVERRLQQVDLGEILEIDDVPKVALVRAKLMEKVEEALEGDLAGPASAPQAIANSVETTTFEDGGSPGPIDPMDQSAALAMEQLETDSDGDAEKVEKLVDDLEAAISGDEYELEHLERALGRIKQRRQWDDSQ